MTSPNGNGAPPNGAAHTTIASPPKFDPTAMTSLWISSSAGLMRASEILRRGMTEVARLEAELGQQYVQRTIGAMQTPVFGMKPDQLMRAQIDQATQNVDSLVTAMRKIADAFRHTIEESSQALFDGAPKPAAEQSFVASIHIDDPVVRRKPAAAEPIPAG